MEEPENKKSWDENLDWGCIVISAVVILIMLITGELSVKELITEWDDGIVFILLYISVPFVVIYSIVKMFRGKTEKSKHENNED